MALGDGAVIKCILQMYHNFCFCNESIKVTQRYEATIVLNKEDVKSVFREKKKDSSKASQKLANKFLYPYVLTCIHWERHRN